MDRLNSLMRGSMMGGSSAPPGAVSEPKSEGRSSIMLLVFFEHARICYQYADLLLRL